MRAVVMRRTWRRWRVVAHLWIRRALAARHVVLVFVGL
jgi:hypothetical protein